MIIENTEALKAYLTSCLGRLCDADPAALANYILALLKKDKEESELRAFCLDQLEVFLATETRGFVQLLFETLKTKCYLQKTNTDALSLNESETNKPSSPTHEKPPVQPLLSVITEPNKQHTNVKTAKSDKRGVKDEREENSDTQLKSFAVRSTKTRSRSRSPLSLSTEKYTSKGRSGSRGEDDSKRYSTSDEDKRNHATKRSEKRHQAFKTKGKEKSARKDDYRTRRSRSNSWDKVRSWSPSRSHGKSKDKCKEKEFDRRIKHQSDHGDTDYRLPSAVTQPTIGRKRCQDYDERGFCLLGEQCSFDHGADPVVVEDVCVSALNFGVSAATASPKKGHNSATEIGSSETEINPPSSPPPMPPPLPPQILPPLPPIPPPGLFMTEQYNPEEPEMNLDAHKKITNFNYWMNTPPPLSSTAVIPGTDVAVFNPNEPPPPFKRISPNPQRARELIGVHTMSERNSETVFEAPKAVVKEDVCENPAKRKTFDYSRLGIGPTRERKMSNFSNSIDRCSLEIRKIPRQMNTISLLNDYFSKFGTVVNLQVGYENDSESALVQFMTPNEANAAYRSTEAVLNNRFIKVFRHNKSQELDRAFNQKTVRHFPSNNSINTGQVGQSSGENFLNENINENNKNNESQSSKAKEQASSGTMFSAKKGKLSRTIYNPKVLKKNNSHLLYKEMKKDSLNKRYELYKKKQDFLQLQFDYQKVLLKKLMKCKVSEQKAFVKEALKDVEKNIVRLQNELKAYTKELLQSVKGAKGASHKEAEKELLDAELDLYNKKFKGDDVTSLLLKVNELRKKAKTLGLNSPYHGMKTRGSGTSFPIRKQGAIDSSRSIDHRTRKIMVLTQPHLTVTKDDLKKYFLQFGDVENIEQVETGYIVIFKTRKEAESVFAKGYRHGDLIKSVAWHLDSPISTTIQDTHAVEDQEKLDQLPLEVEAEDEEEEDEEDSEARSWRR